VQYRCVPEAGQDIQKAAAKWWHHGNAKSMNKAFRT
jgi:hypothetical protein